MGGFVVCESRLDWPDLFVASGAKVGGWPNFYQGSTWQDCPQCSRRMELLLILDVRQWDREGWKRWIPHPEERFHTDWETRRSLEGQSAAQSPSGIDLSDGCINLYYCPICPGMPHAQWYDR